MALRKALTYSKKYARPYTRVSRAKAQAYIKVVPNNKVVKYSVGNLKAYQEGKFNFILRLVAEEPCQIRDNALEASRQLLTKELDEKLPANYFLELKVHPHHIQRNNKAAAGAGADRLSSGMSRAFGTIEGRAGIVRAGQDVFVIHCDSESAARVVREALRMTKSKLPCSTGTKFEKLTSVKA
jgi:large subunit ribosomal protein L10e